MPSEPVPEQGPTVDPDNPHRQNPELERFWLKALIGSADDAIISKTLNGIITSWNRGAERIFGYTPEEVIGKPVTILIPPENVGEEAAILSRIRAGERIEHYETIRVRKDGSRVEISLTISPIKDANDQIIGASKVARDITKQRQAQRQLDESAARLNLALVASNLGDWSWDAATDVVTLSETAASIFGIPAEPRLTWAKLRELLHEDDQERARLAVEESIAQNHDYDIEYRILKNGSVHWVSAKGHGQYKQDGSVTGMLGVVQDITARKRVESALREQTEAAKRARLEAERAAAENEVLYRQAEDSNRLKDEFLATISHELRTPLTAILGWSRMLRSHDLSPAEYTKALETIERNAHTQAQLIDDLLDVSRIITGKLRMDVRPSNPSSFIEAAIEALQPAAVAKGVQVQKILDTGAVSVPGDPVRLQQVVWNLLSNAIKFTPRGGRVQVRLERVNSHIEIVISDTGQGISSEFLPFVFDRFRQADQRTSRQYGGMGLGLSIVRHLVELHGGSVQAASPGEGKGATFTVQLPVSPIPVTTEVRTHPSARDLLPSTEALDRLDGLTILVVDDEPDTREFLRSGLSQCGAELMLAASAQDALAAMKEKVPDVLVSDIGMPDVDGYELIQQLRKLPPEQGGKVPAIALTAYARVEDRMRALRAGYQMHVPKPVELAELVAVAASLARHDT